MVSAPLQPLHGDTGEKTKKCPLVEAKTIEPEISLKYRCTYLASVADRFAARFAYHADRFAGRFPFIAFLIAPFIALPIALPAGTQIHSQARPSGRAKYYLLELSFTPARDALDGSLRQ